MRNVGSGFSERGDGEERAEGAEVHRAGEEAPHPRPALAGVMPRAHRVSEASAPARMPSGTTPGVCARGSAPASTAVRSRNAAERQASSYQSGRPTASWPRTIRW